MERDEWMTDKFMDVNSKHHQPNPTPGIHSREINPYWGQHGTGFPAEIRKDSLTVINSWTRAKVKRTLESIEKGEVTLEEAAVERFGSIEEFKRLCRLLDIPISCKSNDTKIPFESKEIKIDEQINLRSEKKRKICIERKDAADDCPFCLDSLIPPKILSEAGHTILIRPAKPIDPFHCMITTKYHEQTTLKFDLFTMEEIRNYKKTILKLYQKYSRVPVFIELCRRTNDPRQHAVIECFGIPMDSECDFIAEPNAYFRKAVSDAESYWSQHRPIIECSEGLKRALPHRPFPFIHIDLWTESFVHIIEEDRWFPSSWPSDHAKRLMGITSECKEYKFQEIYELFDWTKSIIK